MFKINKFELEMQSFIMVFLIKLGHNIIIIKIPMNNF